MLVKMETYAGVSIFCALLQSFAVSGYVSKCISGGFKCASCEELVHCVATTDGFRSTVINFCNNSEKKYCSAEKGGCVDDPNVCRIFGRPALNCQSAGPFPDPYDCNSYHMCRNENGVWTSTKHNCPPDRAFDPLTAICRFKMTHRVCQENPVEKCEKPLQNGALLENPNVYYVCVLKDEQLEPWFFKCKMGQSYANHACVEQPSAVNFICRSAGNFIDTKDCYSYYECDSDLKSIHKTCRPGTHFDEKEKICIKGQC